MKEILNLEIKNVKSIHEANIEINKINVIGGVNGSGKSTVSKIFYSFLKANSEDRKTYLHKDFIGCINHHIEYLVDEKIDVEDIPELLTSEEDYSSIIGKLEKISEIFDKNEPIVNKREEELSKLILEKFNKILDELEEKTKILMVFAIVPA